MKSTARSRNHLTSNQRRILANHLVDSLQMKSGPAHAVAREATERLKFRVTNANVDSVRRGINRR